MCPDLELNLQIFGVWTMLQSNELPSLGIVILNYSKLCNLMGKITYNSFHSGWNLASFLYIK